MDKPTMQHVVLSQRPEGPASENHFRLETKPMPVPAQDDVLVELSYLSVDPYMRGRMDDVRSYATHSLGQHDGERRGWTGYRVAQRRF